VVGRLPRLGDGRGGRGGGGRAEDRAFVSHGLCGGFRRTTGRAVTRRRGRGVAPDARRPCRRQPAPGTMGSLLLRKGSESEPLIASFIEPRRGPHGHRSVRRSGVRGEHSDAVARRGAGRHAVENARGAARRRRVAALARRTGCSSGPWTAKRILLLCVHGTERASETHSASRDPRRVGVMTLVVRG
jgi:hypothetical protein